MGLKVLSLCLLSLLSSDGQAVMNSTPSAFVNTRLGRIKGTIESVGAEDGAPVPRPFYSFRGIPYAEAGRWKDPLPVGPWNGELDATNYRSSCPQFERTSGKVIGQEDCLFLNVFTPHPSAQGRSDGSSSERQSTVHLPVMVWFHGGGYVRGGSQQFGPHFMMREDVVLVTVNYRLGVLGFLSTGDKNLAGNYGMLDQIESLKWVREHISHFGGDPGRVTIFGESAGAAIVHLLSLSPLATGLFHQVIAQSASALCDWSVERQPLDYARSVAAVLDCPRHPALLVECLRQAPFHELVGVQTDLLEYSLFPVRSAPVVDSNSRVNPFLPDSPQTLIESRRYRPLPMILGLNPNEGLLFYLWIHYENMAKMPNRAFLERELFPGVVATMTKNKTQLDAVVNIVRQQYFGDSDFGDAQTFLPRFSQVMDDALFTSCVYNAQSLTAKTSTAPLYAYLFDYRGQETPSYAAAFGHLVRQSGFDHSFIDTGVTHADELLYLFRMAGLNAVYSAADMQMSQLMTRFWATFATTGNPADAGSGRTVWPRVSAVNDEVVYLHISSLDNRLGVDFRKMETNFWTKVLPYVREMTSSLMEDNHTSLAAVWALLGLFVASVTAVVVLVLAIVFKERKRRYPANGSTVVLRRTN